MNKLDKWSLLLEIDKKIYNKEAIFATSYKFTDEGVFRMQTISEFVIGVYFKLKSKNQNSIEDIANKFLNELIDQQLRISTENRYKHIRDAIVKQAFSPIDE